MADPGIIIGDLLPVGVTFRIQYSFFFLSKLRTYQVPEDEVKTKAVTANKINNCHIWVYIWNKVTVQSLFLVVNKTHNFTESLGF